MKLLFLCSSLEPGRDGVGDYTRRLAGECIRQGHEARIISLNDKAGANAETLKTETAKLISAFRFLLSNFLECQESEGTDVWCLRLPGSLSWPQRVALAGEWVGQFTPDWISLQFVPYGFHPKGLPLGLAKRLRRLIGAFPLHIMFHELWIGSARSSPWQHRPVGFLQRWCIRQMLRRLQPRVVHTSIPIYQAMLEQIGTGSTVLPLFGNIPVATPDPDHPLPPEFASLKLDPLVEDPTLWIGILFGNIYLGWEPQPLLTQLHDAAAKQSRKLVLISVGKAGSNGEKLMDQIRQTFPGITCLILGSQSEKTISLVLQHASFGLATTPWQLIGKSGTVSALLDHGLPVIVTRDDWKHPLFDTAINRQTLKRGLIPPGGDFSDCLQRAHLDCSSLRQASQSFLVSVDLLN